MKLNQVPNEVAKREQTKSQAKIQALRSAQKHQISVLAEDLANGGAAFAELTAKVLEKAKKIAAKRVM